MMGCESCMPSCRQRRQRQREVEEEAMSDEPTTVSWKVIEPKWKVLSADGNEIGEVYLTVGDENADIFDGLAITHHGGPALLHDYTDRPRYVSADQVASIQEGVVRLTITCLLYTSDAADE